MMGSESIDLGLKNIWKSWFQFRKGKRTSNELHTFQYALEKNLQKLFEDLNNGTYIHGCYRKFVVCDNKRREISVASIRDRVVHRLVYDFLEKIYDKTFIDDAWSCRKNKGLLGAIKRTNYFLKCSSTHTHTARSHFLALWKGDVRKFFDSVDQEILLKILSLRIKDNITFNLLKEIITSYSIIANQKIGMPIGNLTSQIFANIYLNELDRFVKHTLKPRAYLRYGDDFVIFEHDFQKLQNFRQETVKFINENLKLQINHKSDRMMKADHGLKYLGIKLWPNGRTLTRRNISRTKERLKSNNLSSYSGLVKQHGNRKRIKEFNWLVYEKLLADI